MVHRMIKVNLNITVFVSALYLGMFKKSQTVHKTSGRENYETSFLRLVFCFFKFYEVLPSKFEGSKLKAPYSYSFQSSL
jgi:hypothetical protein